MYRIVNFGEYFRLYKSNPKLIINLNVKASLRQLLE